MKFEVPLTIPRTRLTRFGREVRGERSEDRDPAAHGGFEAQRGAVLARDRLEARAVVGDDVLVGGHDRRAHRQGGRDQRVGRLVAAHELDDDVGAAVRHEVGRGIGDELRGQPGGDRPVRLADGDPDQLQARAVGRPQLRPPLDQRAGHLAADGPGAEQHHAQRGGAQGSARLGRDIAVDGSRRRRAAGRVGRSEWCGCASVPAARIRPVGRCRVLPCSMTWQNAHPQNVVAGHGPDRRDPDVAGRERERG